MVSQQSQEQTLLEENLASGNGTAEMEIEDIVILKIVKSVLSKARAYKVGPRSPFQNKNLIGIRPVGRNQITGVRKIVLYI